MAILHINWHGKPGVGQAIDGPFLSRNKIDINTGAASSPVMAPAGADHATIWSDGAFVMRLDGTAADDATSQAIPANTMVPINGIEPSKTTITARQL